MSLSASVREAGVGNMVCIAAPAATIMLTSTPVTMRKARRESRMVLP